MDKTIEYYNFYAEDYVNTTQSVDFHLIRERFLSALKAAFPEACKEDMNAYSMAIQSATLNSTTVYSFADLPNLLS